MILPDVNVLIYAFRKDAKSHHIARAVLDPLFAGDTRFGISPLTLGALVRVTTNARTFVNASSLEEAFGFCDDIYSHGNCQIVGSRRPPLAHLRTALPRDQYAWPG